MNLQPAMREKFVGEIRYAVGKMRATTNAMEKLYYFSAVYGMAYRVFNFEYDAEIVFIHQITNAAYGTINARIAALTQRVEGGVEIPPNLFTKLEDALEDLAKRIEKDQETYPVLETISTLAYSATGNGYYLYLKGILKI